MYVVVDTFYCFPYGMLNVCVCVFMCERWEGRTRPTTQRKEYAYVVDFCVTVIQKLVMWYCLIFNFLFSWLNLKNTTLLDFAFSSYMTRMMLSTCHLLTFWISCNPTCLRMPYGNTMWIFIVV
jgi:hypothetical protein